MATPKPNKDEPETTRLTAIRVHEVSLVDRAANRRRFLLTKRDETMAGQLAADGRGGFVLKGGDEDDEKKKGKGQPDPEKDPKAAEKKTDEVDGDGEKKPKGKGEGDEDDAKKAKPKSKEEDDEDGEEEDAKKDAERKLTVSKLAATAERILDVAKAHEGGEPIPEGFAEEVAKMALACVGAKKPVEKSEQKKAAGPEGEFTELKKQLGELTQTVAKQAETIAAQEKQIGALKEQPGSSNVRSPESVSKGAGVGSVVWPEDLSAPEPKIKF